MQKMQKLLVLSTVGILCLVSCSGMAPQTNGDTPEQKTQTEEHTQAEITKKTVEDKFSELPSFDSCEMLKDKISETQEEYERNMYGLGAVDDMVGMPMNFTEAESAAPLKATSDAGSSQGADEFSTTNVQMEGVDEADIVKTDGEYIYTVSGNMITISRAFRPENAMLITTIDYDNYDELPTYSDYQYVSDMFINDDSLVVFGSRSYAYPPTFYEKLKESFTGYYPYYDYRSVTFVDVYDVSDKQDPELKRSLELEGSYIQSRMIGENVYFVVDKYLSYGYAEPVPMYRDSLGMDFEDEESFETMTKCEDIAYFEPFNPHSFIIVGALNLENLEEDFERKVALGSAENIYSSMDNLYVAQTEYRYYYDVDLEDDEDDSIEKTSIYKFALEDGTVKYQGNGQVPGYILNQFSMDEYDNHFRIATTTGTLSRTDSSTENNVFVLDEDLNIVGSVRNIAPGESIFSMRFMGKRGYMVTFKKVDPFFVLDLEDHTDPTILGKLKIPGYSDYLHPMDENHIIGIGKDSVPAEESEGDFAWYQGVKMAVFDVTDVEQPKELHKVIIGDRGTDSPALHDHRAFLYDNEKELLAIPITIAEIDEDLKNDPDAPGWTYGDTVFQGAIVYNLTVEDGFNELGKITHLEDEDAYLKSGYYFYSYDTQIKRSLYMENYLYTVSDSQIRINDLEDNLNEVNKIVITEQETYEEDFDGIMPTIRPF